MTKTKILPKIVSYPVGSTVTVQHENRGLWTHGMIEGKGNHDHHNRSYIIHITKTVQLVIQNRQHIKPTQISAEQYLCQQLQKHTKTDPLENILIQLEQQQMATNIINNTMDHTVSTPHMTIQQLMKKRTLIKENGKKILDKK